MRVLVLVIVSFDKPVYHDMLAVWRERVRDDVRFIQCKSDKEWIGDIINDLRELRSLRAQPDGCKNSHFLESQSLSLGSLKDRFELVVANKTLYVRGDECLIPGPKCLLCVLAGAVVVAAGGVAGSNYLGGGGALGGWFINFVSGQTYNVTIGNGGIYGHPNNDTFMSEGQIDSAGSVTPGQYGTIGGNTTFTYNAGNYTVTGGSGGQGGIGGSPYVYTNKSGGGGGGYCYN